LIGLALGADALGYYTIAFNWGAMIAVTMSLVVNSVLFPTLSRLQVDRAQLGAIYLTTLHYITAIGVAANLVLFFAAPELLVVLLGRGTDKWLPALDTLRVLCVYGVARVVLEPLASVIMALGKPAVMLRTNAIVGALEIALLYPAVVHGGILGAAIVVTLAYALQYLLYYPFVRVELAIGSRQLWTAVSPGLLAAGASAPVLFLAAHVVGGERTALTLLLKVLVALLIYVAAFGWLTRWELLAQVRGRARSARIGDAAPSRSEVD
jgi:lipopolysaccharide exporter